MVVGIDFGPAFWIDGANNRMRGAAQLLEAMTDSRVEAPLAPLWWDCSWTDSRCRHHELVPHALGTTAGKSKMDIIEGKVLRLQFATQVGGSSSQVSTSHLATLQLGKVPVRLQMPQPIMVAEGDNLAVGGQLGSDGIFQGYAYKNKDNGARGKGTGLASLILGLVFGTIGAIAGLIVLLALSGLFGGDLVSRLGAAAFCAVFMLGFGIGGISQVKLYFLTDSAARALR